MRPTRGSQRLRSIALLTAASMLLGGLACDLASPGSGAIDPESIEWASFQAGPFEVPIPDWPEQDVDDESILLAVSSHGWTISVGRHELVPRVLGRHFERVLPEHGDFASISLDDGSPDQVTLNAVSKEKNPSILKMVFLYCEGMSYQVTGSAPEDSAAGIGAVMDHMLAEVTCEATVVRDPAGQGLVGLLVNPNGDSFDFLNYRSAAAQAREIGIQATHHYLAWGQVETAPGEFDWMVPDLMLDTLALEGLRLSVVIEYIHTSVPGEFPEGVQGRAFNDPEFIRGAAKFATEVAKRYGDQLDYLALGNEVNIYFHSHEEELGPYLEAFKVIRQAVHEVKPDLPVGTVLAFHEAVSAGRFDLIEAFKVGDFLAYTYYPHAPGFRYDVATDGFGTVLARMVEASGKIPFIIVENGFSSAGSLGSDESRQAEYVRATFEALAERREDFGTHIWVFQHDLQPQTCEQIARSFFPEDFDPASVEEEMWTAFQDYLCYLGFRHSDGTPKEAWEALEEGLGIYFEKGG